MRRLLVLSLILVFTAAGARATVSFDYTCTEVDDLPFNPSGWVCSFDLILMGTIDDGMLKRFRLALAELPRISAVAPRVLIDSPGGSLKSAMEIGRIVRQREMTVRVPQYSSCASACVLIFAAGVRRETENNIPDYELSRGQPLRHRAVGIHRAYIAETPQQPVTLAEVKQATDRTVAALRAYFHEMNVSERLADDMMAVAPEKIRWLIPSEQFGYGLVAIDPVWQETRDLNQAQKFGLSRPDYMQRKMISSQVCGPAWEFSDCYFRVMRTGR